MPTEWLIPVRRHWHPVFQSSSNSADAALKCMVRANPEIADKIALADCATKATDTQAAASCFTKIAGGDPGKIAECAAGERGKLISCLLAACRTGVCG